MSDNIDFKTVSLVALGVVALFSSYKVYLVTKKLN